MTVTPLEFPQTFDMENLNKSRYSLYDEMSCHLDTIASYIYECIRRTVLLSSKDGWMKHFSVGFGFQCCRLYHGHISATEMGMRMILEMARAWNSHCKRLTDALYRLMLYFRDHLLSDGIWFQGILFICYVYGVYCIASIQFSTTFRTHKGGNCECIATWRPLDVTPVVQDCRC